MPSRKNPGATKSARSKAAKRAWRKRHAKQSMRRVKQTKVKGRRGRRNPTMRMVIETGAPVRISRSAGRAGAKKMAKKRRSAKQRAWAKKFGKKFGGSRKKRSNPRRKHRSHRKARSNPRRRRHRKHRKNPSRAEVRAAFAKPRPGAMQGPTRETLTKHQKRVKAGKKAARTRKRNLAKKHGKRKGHKKAHRKSRKGHRKVRRSRRKVRSWSRTIKRLGSVAKKGSRYARRRNMSKSRRRRARQMVRVVRARRSALVVRHGLARGAAGGKYARAHGLTRVNPSFAGLKTDLITLLPFAGVGIGSFLGLAVAAPKLTGMLPEAVKAKIPASVAPFVPAIGTGILSVVAYAALRMSKNAKLQRFAPWALAGGLGATTLHVIANMQVADPADASKTISLAKKLGLPLGEFVGVSGYVESASGQQIAVNGLGEFVGVSGSLIDASGQRIAVNGFGDYVPGEVGLGGGGIFAANGTKSSLGRLGMAYDGQSNQDPGGREWSHGLSQEESAEDVLAGDDEEGSLSGDIFGDN